MHLRIFKDDDGENTFYRLGEFDRKFSSIVQMVRHYSINRQVNNYDMNNSFLLIFPLFPDYQSRARSICAC